MIAVELFRFPQTAGDPLEGLLASATRNLERHGSLPWMVMGVSATERLVVVGAGTEPSHLSAIEQALLALPECTWTVLAGQLPLASGAGWLEHALVRQLQPSGAWTAWVRPQTDTPQGIAWLGDWARRDGDQPLEEDPFFPPPSEDLVQLARPAPPPTATWSQDLPEGVEREEMVDQLGDFACRWFSSEGTLPPMVVRQVARSLEGLVLPENAQASVLSDVAIRWANQPETLAVGTCRRKAWPAGGRGGQQIHVVWEVRTGPAWVWWRRYRVEEHKGRWESSTGQRNLRPAETPRAWLP